jgi:hypothetical protein
LWSKSNLEHLRRKSLFPVHEPVQLNFSSTFTEPMFKIHKFVSPHVLTPGQRSMTLPRLE